MIRFPGLLLAIACLTACGPDVVYERTQSFGPDGWSYADSVAFTYEIQDTAARYDLVLTVEHATDYPTQNLYLLLNTHVPTGESRSQPLSLDLADEFGQWYGDCDEEGCETELSIQTETRFPVPGSYRLVAAQFTRRDPVKEIESLAFRVIRR